MTWGLTSCWWEVGDQVCGPCCEQPFPCSHSLCVVRAVPVGSAGYVHGRWLPAGIGVGSVCQAGYSHRTCHGCLPPSAVIEVAVVLGNRIVVLVSRTPCAARLLAWPRTQIGLAPSWCSLQLCVVHSICLRV